MSGLNFYTLESEPKWLLFSKQFIWLREFSRICKLISLLRLHFCWVVLLRANVGKKDTTYRHCSNIEIKGFRFKWGEDLQPYYLVISRKPITTWRKMEIRDIKYFYETIISAVLWYYVLLQSHSYRSMNYLSCFTLAVICQPVCLLYPCPPEHNSLCCIAAAMFKIQNMDGPME